MRICSHVSKRFIMEKFIFVHWFVQVNRQKTTVNKKITYFLKNYVASLFTIFEKVLAICKFFFTAPCLDVRFWDLLYFIVWSSIHSIVIFRSSHPKVFLWKGVLKICSKFTGEHTCRSAISIKFLCNFIEIALRHGCSPVNLLHIFRTPFPRNTSGRLLLPKLF